jgi:hypothetical protein
MSVPQLHQCITTPLQVSIRGHEVRSARLAHGQPVDVEPGETIEFEGVGEDYIRWTGGRLGSGYVKIGLSLRNVGLAAKPGETAGGLLSLDWIGFCCSSVACYVLNCVGTHQCCYLV